MFFGSSDLCVYRDIYVAVPYLVIVLLTILFRRNALLSQPKAQTIFNLMAHASGECEALLFIKSRGDIEQPVVMHSHVEKNSGVFYIAIRTDCDDRSNIDLANVFHKQLGSIVMSVTDKKSWGFG